MHILLIYPSYLEGNCSAVKYRKALVPPLSLAILAALVPPKHKVSVVNDLVEQVDFEGAYDLVGITSMTMQAPRAYQIADQFRRRGIPVVMGGIHASMLPEEAAQHADAVFIGEAEEIWPQVIEDAEKSHLKKYYKQDKPPALDKMIMPRWDLMNLGIYPRRFGSSRPMMPLFTTRGCPYGCKFCAASKFYGRSFRTRPLDVVQQEIQGTKAKELFFTDDNIGAQEDYSRELFRMVRRQNVRWMSQISTKVLQNPDLLELAAASGCFYLFIGMESLNQKNLISVNKGFNDVAAYEELIVRTKKAGIVPILSFIFGFDEDISDQFRITVEFLRRNQVGFVTFYILTPSPGTDLYQEFAAEDRIREVDWSLYDGTHAVFNPEGRSHDSLEKEYWETYREMYSLLGMVRNCWWNVRVANTPVSEFCRNILYQPIFRSKVAQREHPFSGGISRV